MPANTSNTTSDNGRNIRPELKSESYFFIEPGKNFTQSDNEKFGIVSNSNNASIFRTTSQISGYSGKIYTICKGQVFVQPNSSSLDKVNIILKPFVQPINGLAIKYIIYRGLNKQDFFANAEVKPGDASDATEFVKHIRAEFQALFQMLKIDEPEFLADYIGYQQDNLGIPVDQQQKNEDLIDTYFFKTSDTEDETESAKTAFELPIIPEGICLGEISDETLGIDVILNEGDYTIENDPNPFQLNLSYARASDYHLNKSGYSGLHEKLIKESAAWFIDIAAFYGLHAQGNGKINLKPSNETLQNADDIYNLIKNFKTKNTVYLYIQSNRQRSYNFYGNYSVTENNMTSDVRISINGTTYEDKKFNENWPIYEFNNVPHLLLQLVTDNNPNAGLFIKQGILHSSVNNEDYFIRNNNLLQQAAENVDLRYTKPIKFDFIKTESTQNVSSLMQLIYEGASLPVKISSSENQTEEILYIKDVDDVFGLTNATPHLKRNSDDLTYVVDQNLLLINFENKTGGQDIATVTTKRVEDRVMKDETESIKRITYETLLNNIRQNTGSFFQSRTAYQDNSNSGIIAYSKNMNNFYTPEKPYYLQTEVFTGSDGNTITGLSLQVQDGSLPSKKLLGITDDENALFADNQLNNLKFYFKNELEDEESSYTSSEGISYKKYSLYGIGENQNGELEVYEPIDKIYVTTVDSMVFASEDYAKFIPFRNTKEITLKLDLF